MKRVLALSVAVLLSSVVMSSATAGDEVIGESIGARFTLSPEEGFQAGWLSIANGAGGEFWAYNTKGALVAAGPITCDMITLSVSHSGPDVNGIYLTVYVPGGVLLLDSTGWEWCH